ncbi:MAG: cytidylate kinase [Rhodospirillaceae bacterium]|nr:cytidylate kinase [Rhodospirillaceae bacterium]
MIIAIDGPAAAGKGTIARKLANHFNLSYLDTGTLYRAVALSMLQSEADINDAKSATYHARNFPEELIQSPEIRTSEIGMAASHIASIGSVRKILLQFQRNFAANPTSGKDGAVLDGRDIATIVCPDANFKIFITAKLEIRAKRRLKELLEREQTAIYCQVLDELRERDRQDSLRKESPMLQAEGAMLLDTSYLTVDQAYGRARDYIASERF